LKREFRATDAAASVGMRKDFVHVDASGIVRLDVCDTGKPSTYAPALPGVTTQCGRGLVLVSQFGDRVVRAAKERVEASMRR